MFECLFAGNDGWKVTDQANIALIRKIKNRPGHDRHLLIATAPQKTCRHRLLRRIRALVTRS